MPKASIYMVIKNAAGRARALRLALRSMLSQTIPCQLVIQDGGSTDGTLDIIREFAGLDVVSETDSCPAEGFFRAIARCRGDIVGSCFSDETIPPYAAAVAMQFFDAHQCIGAMYGSEAIIDGDGKCTGIYMPPRYTLQGYLQGTVIPPFSSSWFRNDVLQSAGVGWHRWNMGVGEYELWVRVGCVAEVAFVPMFLLSGYGVHDSLTSKPETYGPQCEERARFMPKLYADNPRVRCCGVRMEEAIAGNWLWAASSANTYGRPDLRDVYFARAREAYPTYWRIEAAAKEWEGK